MFKQYKFGKEMTAYNRNLLSMLKLQINRSLQFLLLVLSTDVRYSEDQRLFQFNDKTTKNNVLVSI